jgi:hypothetical protein
MLISSGWGREVSFVRIVTAVLGMGVLTISQCWAHGHSSPPGPMLQQPSSSSPSTRKPFHDWLQPDAHDQKNPYESLSCPQLYVLATQQEQSADIAAAFKDKDCHAL